MEKRARSLSVVRQHHPRWRLLVAACALAAWCCSGLMCEYDPTCDDSFSGAALDERVMAASDALIVSGGHDYGPITELLQEHYGDAAATAYICGEFIDPPHCFRIAAVNIQLDSIDAAWQEYFCGLERLARQSGSDGSDPEGHFEECMMGIPFLAY